MGDPAGSGPEISIKALKRDYLRYKARIVLIGDFNVFKKASDAVNAENLKLVKVTKPSEAVDQANTINIVDLDNVDSSKLVYGKPSSLGGKASYESIAKAADYALHGD
ncbi:4-hydroxythreonine-4-phosphate dehydrogenase PdxA, partial [Candidatus Bathyarchaeota archaeon]|nr:4-hydroxythreonine-4-phosphate dehydrogenase PdxA [Candidatus Bathyarchaeota archaeon]